MSARYETKRNEMFRSPQGGGSLNPGRQGTSFSQETADKAAAEAYKKHLGSTVQVTVEPDAWGYDRSTITSMEPLTPAVLSDAELTIALATLQGQCAELKAEHVAARDAALQRFQDKQAAELNECDAAIVVLEPCADNKWLAPVLEAVRLERQRVQLKQAPGVYGGGVPESIITCLQAVQAELAKRKNNHAARLAEFRAMAAELGVAV